MTTRSVALVKDNAGTGLTELQVNSAGALKVDLEIDESTLATAANQTNGDQKCMAMGITGAAQQKQLLVESNGAFILGGGSSSALGNTVKDGTGDAKFLLCDADGHLQVDILSGGGGGDASAANQVTGNASLATIAGDTTSLDGKVTACNTGAVVISSGSVTFTNTSIATTSSLSVTTDTLTLSPAGSLAGGGFTQASQDFGATITGGPRKASGVYVKVTNSLPANLSITLSIGVDVTNFIFLSGSPKTTSFTTDVFPLSELTGDDFICPQHLKFGISNGSVGATDVTLSLHYYE